MGSFYGKKAALLLMLSLLNGWVIFSAAPAAAQGPAAIMERPGTEKAEEEKKEEAPTTCGPLISDTCLPIEAQHASMQVLWALSLYPGNFSSNWRRTSASGNFHTFTMPVKFTYGPTKDLETYIVVPFIHNWASDVNPDSAGPNGERAAGYSGVGDITAVAKYLLLPEADMRPAVTAVGGVGFPSGHANHLNPKFLGVDAIGTGSFNFITGVNLYKWLKPFLVYSNIWFNTPINIYKLRAVDEPQAVRSREYVTFNLAAEYPLSKQWVLLLEMYSTWTWSNIGTPQGFQSPSTVLGFLPGIEYFATEKLAFATGCAFDTIGKAGSQKFTPLFTVYYSF
ncbi:MAG: transporter [Desulfobaccales bacterium]